MLALMVNAHGRQVNECEHRARYCHCIQIPTRKCEPCVVLAFMLHTIFPFQSVVSVKHIVAAKSNVSPYDLVVPLESHCWQSVALLYATPHRVSLALSIVPCVSMCFFYFVQSVYFVLIVCWVWRSPEKPIHHSVRFQWYARYDSFRAYFCHNHLFALFRPVDFMVSELIINTTQTEFIESRKKELLRELRNKKCTISSWK